MKPIKLAVTFFLRRLFNLIRLGALLLFGFTDSLTYHSSRRYLQKLVSPFFFFPPVQVCYFVVCRRGNRKKQTTPQKQKTSSSSARRKSRRPKADDFLTLRVPQATKHMASAADNSQFGRQDAQAGLPLARIQGVCTKAKRRALASSPLTLVRVRRQEQSAQGK